MANTILHRSDISDYGTAVYPSAARTATPDTVELEVGDSDGVTLVIDVTAVTATGTLTVKISGVDRVSGKTFDLLSSASLSAVGTTVLQIGPSIPVAANASANVVVPNVIRVTATHGNGVSLTYSVGLLLS